MQNWMAPGNDSLPAESLKIDDDDEEPIVLEHLRAILVQVWDGGERSTKWKDATIKVLYKNGERCQCNKFRGISLLSHLGKVPIKIITNRLSAFCETNYILPEEQCGFRPGRSTIDMLFVVRRLQELGRGRKIPLYMCFVDLKKAYYSVDRELPWKVLARSVIPEEVIAVIRQFHDGMRARVRMDDGEFSARLWVTQCLRQGCALSPLLSNIFCAAVIEVVAIRFSEDDVILQNLVYLEETGAGARTPLNRVRRAVWGMLYADDAGVVSRSPEGLARMMTVIVEVFGKFGLTVSEKTTETLLMRAKEKQTTTPPPPPPPLIIETAGQRGKPEQNWQMCLKDDLKMFEAEHGSTDSEPCFFEVPETTWMEVAKVDRGVPWHTRVLQGAKRFMASWHKKEEKASRQRALKRNKKPGNNTDTATITGAGGVRQADETARKGRKREEGDRATRNTVQN
ncbi:unnamed protein product [Ectocarpus sp. CCAP 1310/34]|nr:unnamed protein product [Ectocarpus sp. CCAP 1310/34]